MMNKDGFEAILEKRPFTPLRLHFSNGATHDVTHPDNVLLSERMAAIAIGDTLSLVAMAHIVEIEPLSAVRA